MKVVFSDIDGTLLTDNKELTSNNLYAINELQKNNIEFVIVSSRPNFGITNILKKYNFKCNIVCFGGGLIIDKNGNILKNEGLSKLQAKEIIDFIEDSKLDLVWNIFDTTKWVCKDINNDFIKNEQKMLNFNSTEGNLDLFDENKPINKILCMSYPEKADENIKILKNRFPNYRFVKSSAKLIEVIPKNINKGNGVKDMCKYLNTSISDTISFGDNYNDVEMLDTTALSFLMENAPEKLKEKYKNITLSNNNDGIYHALVKLNLIKEKSLNND